MASLFSFGNVEPVLEYEDEPEIQLFHLDQYIKAVQHADDTGKAKFAWQMWTLGARDNCRNLPKVESHKALALLATLPTGMLAGLEVKRQSARAFAGFTSAPGGRKIVVTGVQELVTIVQTLLAVNDSFTQSHTLTCIINLCREEKLIKDFITSGLSIEVLHLCDSEEHDNDVVLKSVLALQGLGRQEDIRKQLAAEIVEVMTQLLGNEDSDDGFRQQLIKESMKMFAVMGADADILYDLIQNGCLRKITSFTEGPRNLGGEELLLTYVYMLHELAQGVEQKALLKEHEVLKTLIEMMHRGDIPIAGRNDDAKRPKELSKRVISWTLQLIIGENFVEEGTDVDFLISLGAEPLVSFIRWKLENLYDPILLSLSLLSDEDDDAVSEMVDLSLTNELIHIMAAVNPELAAVDTYIPYTSRILANIACSGRNGPHGIINNEGIEATCTVAEQQYRNTQEQDIQLNCAAILANICGDDFGKVSVVETGALEIIRMQADVNKCGEDVVRTAMLALFCISENDELNLNMVEENVLPVLFRAIAAKEYDEGAVNYAKNALINFLRCGGHEVFPDTIGDDEEYLISAGQALIKLGQTDEYQDLLVNPGVLWILVGMTSNSDVYNQAMAAKFIAELSLTDRYRVAIARHGGLEALDRLSSSEDVEVLRETVRAMRNLCRDPVLMVKIVEFGGIQLFSQYCLSQDLEIQLFTVEALANFSDFPATHERMGDDGGFTALLSLTGHTDVEIATEACRAMATLSLQGTRFHSMIVESAMPALIEIIRSGEVGCQVRAIDTIHGVAQNPEFHLFLDEKQIPNAMLALLKDKSRYLCHPGACRVLAAVASCQKVADMLVDEDRVNFLLTLLDSPEYEVHTSIAQMFANITHRASGQEALSELLIFPKLVNFTSNQPRNSLAAYYGGLTVACMVRAEDADTDIYEDFLRNHAEIGEALIDPRDDHYDCQLVMAKAINTLAESEYTEYSKIMSVPSSVMRQVLLSLEVSESPEVKRLVALSLCKVLGDSATIKDTGPMLDLLTSEDAAAVKLASDAIGAAELVPTGAAGENEYMSQEDVTNLVTKANLLVSGGDNAALHHAVNIYRTLASQKTCHEGLIANGGLEKLMRLTSVDDNDIVISAVFALGGISVHPEFHKFVMAPGTLRQLLPAANLPNQQIQTYLASMLANIAAIDNADIMIAEEGFLEILCKMMTQHNITLLRQASRSLLIFTYSEAHRQEMRHHGMSRTAVSLVHTKDSKVYTTVLKILYDLTSEDYGIIAIEENEGIEAIYLSTKGKGIQDQLLAGRIVCRICSVDECQGTVIASGALTLMRRCAQSNSAEDQQHAGRAMAECCGRFERRQEFVNAGGIPVAVQLSMSDDEAARVCAAQALSDLCTDISSHDLLLQNGVIQPLLAATSMANTIGVRHAVRAVAHLCQSEPFQIEIGSDGAIGHFERIWKIHDLEIARWVNLAMARMTALISNQQRMMNMWGGDEDGFETLVRTHLIHDDLYIRRCGILALSHIATNGAFQSELCEDRLLHLICVCAKRDEQDEEVQRCALETLCSLMQSDDIRMFMADRELMTSFAITNTAILRNSFPRLQEQSYLFLAKLAACDEVKAMLYEEQVTDCLMRGLNHKNILVIGATCTCIGAVCPHNGMRDSMMKLNIITILMNTLNKVEGSRVQTLQVMNVLAILAEDPIANETISSHEGRDKILGLSQRGDPEIREVAIKVVGRMTDVCDVALVLEALESGEASSVALAKYYGNVNHQRRVATKIAKLAIMPKNHQKIIDMGGIRDLITLAFSNDEHVQQKTASALTDLAKIESSRVAMILEGALKPIVASLMQSQFQSVRDNAMNCLQALSWIKKCCVHELKVVEPLVEGIPIRPFGMFVGGQEGDSQHRWYRLERVKGNSKAILPSDTKGIACAQEKKEGTPSAQKMLVATGEKDANGKLAAPAEDGNVEKWEKVDDGEQGGLLTQFIGATAEAIEGVTTRLGIPDTAEEKAMVVETKKHVELDLVEIARTRNYTPTHEDVGFVLRYCWTPLDVQGVRGEIASFTSSEAVSPGPPTCTDVRVARVHPDDALLVGCATYSGGEEGSSLFAWKRIYKTGRIEIIQGCHERTYYPERLDIGCRIIFGYIPVRSDGVRGNIVWSSPSDTVATMPPSFRDFRITGAYQEGRILYPDGKFLGGEEGNHEVQWFRKDPGDENYGIISTNEGMMRSYTPIQRDIGCILRVRLKPENQKEDQGKALFAETTVITHGHPEMRNFRVSGGPFHTSLLLATGEYFGGFEGNSIIQWYRSVFGGPYLPIKGATDPGYQPTIDDVSARICCKYIPVRDDGRKGPMVEAKAVALGIDSKVQNLVSRMLIFGDAQFKVMLKTNEETEPRIFVMDRDGMKVQAGKTVMIPTTYDADSGRIVGGDSDGTEIKASWSEDIRVVLHPTDVKVFMIIFDETEESDDGLIKFEYVADSHKARDVIGLCIRSFCAFCLQTYASKKTRKKAKRETSKEGIKKHRMAWLREIQGRTVIEDTLVELNDKHKGDYAIDDIAQLTETAVDSDAALTDRNDLTEMAKEEEQELYGAHGEESELEALTIANTNANSNPLFESDQQPLVLSENNKYADIQGLLKDKGVGQYGKNYEGEYDDPQKKAKALVASKLSKVTTLLSALPNRTKAKLDDVSPKHSTSTTPGLGSMGTVPGISASAVDLEIVKTPPALQAPLELPSMGGPGVPLSMIDSESPALAVTTSTIDVNPLAIVGSETVRSNQETSRSTRSDTSETTLTPAQRAMAGVAKHIRMKKKPKEPKNPMLQIEATPQDVSITSNPLAVPKDDTKAAASPDKASRPRRGSRDATAKGSSTTAFKAAPISLAQGSTTGDDTARSTATHDSAGQPKKLMIVGDTLDRIKALAAKGKMGKQKQSTKARLADQAAKIAADKETEAIELAKKAEEEAVKIALPKEKIKRISTLGMDTDRSTVSTDSEGSASGKCKPLSGLKGSLMGQLIAKKASDENNANNKLIDAEAQEVRKNFRHSREERLQEFLEKKAAKRRLEETAQLDVGQSKSEGMDTDRSTDSAFGKSDKPNAVMEGIAKAKMEENKKKLGLMLERKKKEAWSAENKRDPKALDSQSAALALIDPARAAITIPDSSNANSVEAASSPALKSQQEYNFMLRGAFFVTSTGTGNQTATVKVCLSKNMDFLTWKSHTERKEWSISLANVVSIDDKAVLRETRHHLSFAINSKCPETWDDKSVIFEAISERAKAQWVEGLQKLSSEK